MQEITHFQSSNCDILLVVETQADEVEHCFFGKFSVVALFGVLRFIEVSIDRIAPLTTLSIRPLYSWLVHYDNLRGRHRN